MLTPPPPRSPLAAFIESRRFQGFVTGLILVNAITLGLETAPHLVGPYAGVLHRLDAAILALFTIELVLRVAVHRTRFFRDPWSLFDLAVVAISLVPSAGSLSVLRAFRVLRVLRLVSVAPSMRRVVAGLLGALPGLSSILGLMVLVFYVAAVLSTRLFGGAFPEWFGSLGASAYTLFQVMTLESWSMGIVRPVMERFPWAWAFFVPYILVATFTMLNLFIAVIVNAMNSTAEPPRPAPAAVAESEILEELRALRTEVASLRRELPPRTGERPTSDPA